MSKFNVEELELALSELNKQGSFRASIVTAESGFVIASSITKGADEELIAATGPAIHSTVQQVNNQIKLGKAQDIIVMAEKGVLVVKILFMKNGGEYILAIIAPSNANWQNIDMTSSIEKIKSILSSLETE